MEDIENKVLRCQNSMAETSKDASRYLRAVRFWCTKGLTIDREFEEYIKEHAARDFHGISARGLIPELKNITRIEYEMYSDKMFNKFLELKIPLKSIMFGHTVATFPTNRIVKFVNKDGSHPDFNYSAMADTVNSILGRIGI